MKNCTPIKSSQGSDSVRGSYVGFSASPKSQQSNLLNNILTQKEQLLLEQIRINSSKNQLQKSPKFITQDCLIDSARRSLLQSHLRDNSPNRLYKYALQRKQNQKIIQQMARRHAQIQAKTPKISKGSYKIMIKKNDDNIQKAFSEVDKLDCRQLTFDQIGRILTLLDVFRILLYNQHIQLQNYTGTLTQNALKRRVQQMNLLQSLWAVVTGNQDLDKADIQPTYLVIKTLTQPTTSSISTRAQKIVSVLMGYWQSHMQGQQFYNKISAQSIINLTKLYKQLQRDRLAFQKIGYFKVNKFSQIVSQQKNKFTFKPRIQDKEKQSRNISQIAQQQDQQQDQKKTRYQLLMQKKQAANRKIQELRKQKQQKQMEKCTFQPNLKRKKKNDNMKNSNLLQRLYHFQGKQQKQQRQRKAKQQRQQQQLEECTFRPLTIGGTSNRVRVKSQILNDPPPGYQKAVGRLRYANKLNKIKKYQQQHISSGENYKGPGYKIVPPSFLNRQKKKKQPLFYVQINLGNGKVGKIGIHQGDQPRQLAKNFCKIYSLGGGVEQDIQAILLQQMEAISIKQNSQFNEDD